LKDKRATIVINPDKEAGELKGDVVLTALGKDTAPVKDAYETLDWPGEYEVKGVAMMGIPAWTKSKSKEDEEGKKGEETLMFFVDMGGVKICHMGAIGHTLSSEAVKMIGDVDILILDPTKDGNLGTKKAMEILESIDPKALIPMGKGDFKEFLKEAGAENIEAKESYEIDSLSQLPPDKREYIILRKA
jgi:L-ascorbate metabolism protein UlaG (beta-lactamase superfamily)